MTEPATNPAALYLSYSDVLRFVPSGRLRPNASQNYFTRLIIMRFPHSLAYAQELSKAPNFTSSLNKAGIYVYCRTFYSSLFS